MPLLQYLCQSPVSRRGSLFGCYWKGFDSITIFLLNLHSYSLVSFLTEILFMQCTNKYSWSQNLTESSAWLLFFLSTSLQSLPWLPMSFHILPLAAGWRLNACTLIWSVRSVAGHYTIYSTLSIVPIFYYLGGRSEFQLRWCYCLSDAILDCSPGGGMVSQQVKAKKLHLHYRRFESCISPPTPPISSSSQFLFTSPPLWPSVSLHPITPVVLKFCQILGLRFPNPLSQISLFYFKLLMSSFISTPPYIHHYLSYISHERKGGRSRGDLSDSYLSLCVAALNSLQ